MALQEKLAEMTSAQLSFSFQSLSSVAVPVTFVKIPDQAKLREGSFRQCEGAAHQDGNSWWWSHGGRSLLGLVALCPQSRSRE